MPADDRPSAPASLVHLTPVAVAIAFALVVSGCGGNDSGGDSALPEGCEAAGAMSVPIEGGEQLPGIDGPTFEVTSMAGSVQPIIPDPDSDPSDVDIDAVVAEAAETDFVAYTVYLADFDIGDDLDMFGLTPPADGTVLSFTVVPPTSTPLVAGDVVESGRPEFESTTTFATLGTFYDSGATDGADPVFLSTDSEDEGQAEILFVDDERICLSVTQTGSILGGAEEADWSIDTTVVADLVTRQRLPFS